ncbi:hypothetical protein [Streptomyces sp. YPW6]|uniref:hypothetical protein n=1 Tax=Streptomyces sp. YPW6 TaxID=2840373 RepID=UPI003D71E9C7
MAAVPLDLLDRIRALERQVRELTGRAQIRPALDEILHGDVVIGEGGQLITQAPNGNRVFISGQTPQGDWGVGIGREDGTAALTVGDDILEAAQMIRMWSRDRDAPDRILAMDDAFSDRFLGRPWIPLQLHPTERQNTAATSYEPAWVGGGPAFNAVARISLSTWANTGGGQVRVRMTPSGQAAVTVAEYDCPAGQWTSRLVEQPLHGVEFMQYVGWVIEHRNKSTGQDIETRLFTATGRNTFNEGEAPDVPARTAAAAATPAPVDVDLAPTTESPAEPGLRTIDD